MHVSCKFASIKEDTGYAYPAADLFHLFKKWREVYEDKGVHYRKDLDQEELRKSDSVFGSDPIEGFVEFVVPNFIENKVVKHVLPPT